MSNCEKWCFVSYGAVMVSTMIYSGRIIQLDLSTLNYPLLAAVGSGAFDFSSGFLARFFDCGISLLSALGRKWKIVDRNPSMSVCT